MEDESGEISQLQAMTVSYLQARDPSILSWNHHGFGKGPLKRTHLKFSSCLSLPSADLSSDSQEEEEEVDDDSLKVYLRIKASDKPLNKNLYRVEQNALITKIAPDSLAPRNQTDRKKLNQVIYKKFYFTDIFDTDASQVDIFNYVVKRKVLSFINGKTSTLLAYGASGAGKTFTMVGTADEPGIIPRSLDYLFRTIGREGSIHEKPTSYPFHNNTIILLSENDVQIALNNLKSILQNPQTIHENEVHITTYKQMQQRLSTLQVGTVADYPPIRDVWVSFAEIYNENIHDLLEEGKGTGRPKLQIGGLQDDCFIKGLKHIYVRSGLEAYQVMQYGLHNLSYAATAVNSHSSRSHCIFSIRLIAGRDEKNFKMSVFNFCDLAGAERVKKTLNAGKRLKESNKINNSLSVLSRCIQIIRSQQRKNLNITAPFRESKLTQLFQKGLKGKEDIAMIININPSPDVFHESQHALTFSAIAKEITQDIEETKSSSSCDDQEKPFDSLDAELQLSEMEVQLKDAYNQISALILENGELNDENAVLREKLEDALEMDERKDELIESQARLVEQYKESARKYEQDCKKFEKEIARLNAELWKQIQDKSNEADSYCSLYNANQSQMSSSSNDSGDSVVVID